MHFRVGEVQTAFHTLKVRVSAEQGRMEKLQDGNHVRETKLVSGRNPPEREAIKVGPERGLFKLNLVSFLMLQDFFLFAVDAFCCLFIKVSVKTRLQDPHKKICEGEDLSSEDGKYVCCYCDKTVKFIKFLPLDFLLNRVCTVQENNKTLCKGTALLEEQLYRRLQVTKK